MSEEGLAVAGDEGLVDCGGDSDGEGERKEEEDGEGQEVARVGVDYALRFR